MQRTEFEFLAPLFRREGPHWPQTTLQQESFLKSSAQENLQPLIYYLLHEHNFWDSTPAPIQQALSKSAKVEALVDGNRLQELKKVFEEFKNQGIEALVFKGSALGMTIYPAEYLRPRCDTDLLIRETDRDKTHEVLIQLGYQRSLTNTGELISYQWTYLKVDALGFRNTLDVHWRLSNPQVFANLFTFDELMEKAQPLPKLGSSARAPGLVHALLIACFHRVAHHFDEEELLWLYDIHLMVTNMSEGELQEFEQLAKQKKLSQICRRSLELSQKWFATSLPQGLANQPVDVEDSALYLNPNRKWYFDVVQDFKNLEGIEQKLKFLKEHALPSPEYMKGKYPHVPKALLPAAYMHRFIKGLRKVFGRFKP